MEIYSNLQRFFFILFFSTLIFLIPIIKSASDVITSTQPLTTGDKLVSAAGRFELGFFSPGNSGKLYVGIWYKDILPTRTYVFVLNRDNPLTNSFSSSSAALQIGRDGNIVLTDNSSNTLWTSNSTTSPNTVAQLLDSGNLILRSENNVDPQDYIWQSFDHPTDTLLPGMKLGWDLKTGINRILRPWKSPDDPSTGDYSFKLNITGSPEAFLWSNNKQRKIYGSGPWNGEGFNGVPGMKSTDVIQFIFVMNSTEVAYSFSLLNESLYSRLTVNPSGVLQRLTWIETTGAWRVFWYAPADQCDNYMECGVYGICDTNSSPVCNCPKGFNPKNEQAWSLRDGSGGCERMDNLNCNDDGFLLLNNMKMPDSSSAYVSEKMSLAECEMGCRTNCLCMGYGYMDIRGNGSGCVMWTGDLIDMRRYTALEGGQDFYLRVSVSDVDRSNNTRNIGSQKQIDGKKKGKTILIVSFLVGFSVVLIALLLCFAWKKRSRKAQNANIVSHSRVSRERSQDMLFPGGVVSKREYSGENTIDEELDLPLFDLGTITVATSNFSDANKLGQGGFGCVYKGLLIDGQIIAVKRLSKNSGQGVEEFKNEMRLIAKLQHRNLVRLLGCCIDLEEKMLIYEYMENKSLDSFIFSRGSHALLDCERRFSIICGIARGLLYLHQDSRFRIIHRDLKASNVLLDKDMNPKISDFGMARIFGTDQTEANTRRVVGTYGYMSPEYAMDGLFSVKSDVFSFGVLVLEILSGKKNRGFYYENQQLNLLGHAWRLWREGKAMELVDSSVRDSYLEQELTLMRCIQVGLLCVQERAEDRPTMANVVLMLSSETTLLPQPKQPGFCLGRQYNQGQAETSSSMMEESCSVNHVTVTILDGR